ncbi:MAG: glycosyltransferase family 2 protein [Bacteroidota bacterium]
MSNTPKVSIITVTYQAEAFLSRTLASVREQTYPNVEHILIDGGSKDKTLEIARSEGQHLAKIVSEKDRGIYDAMNKGAKLATGKWVNFMNAGDTFFAADSIERAISQAKEESEVLYGDFEFIHEGFREIIKPISLDTPWIKMKLNHQTVFYDRQTLLGFPYEMNNLAADFTQLYGLYHAQKKYQYLGFSVASFLDGGVGNSLKVKLSTREVIRRYDKRLSTDLKFWKYIAYSVLLDTLKTHIPRLFDWLSAQKLKSGLDKRKQLS